MHGQEHNDRVPDLGGTNLFYVPIQLRAELDLTWRVGAYLCRSKDSDHNIMGLPSGQVTRAGGMVRMGESKTWPRTQLERITVTPLTERPGALTEIEEDMNPHAGPPKTNEDSLRRR